ncbi:MAG: hypothetical protein KA210_06140 [Bacteroidia bacterium]|nr:hypothetical protein [Bacteroidia bacterium]
MLTKREQYGLTFTKWMEPESNELYNICSRDEVGVYSHLTFIRYLNVGELNAIIKEITNAQNGQIYDSLPSSDSYEDVSLELSFPNITIDDVLTVPMEDFKELLLEWIDFISIEPSQTSR